MDTATLTSKGQLTLPANVRRRLGLRAGDRLTFEDDGNGGFRLVAMNKTHEVAQLAGLLKQHAPARPLSVAEMDDAIACEAGRSGMAGIGIREPSPRRPRKK
jgi:antitoxin PrlF